MDLAKVRAAAAKNRAQSERRHRLRAEATDSLAKVMALYQAEGHLKNQIVLNYNYGFWRMTQLFGRSLFIKYYRKEEARARPDG